MNGVSIIDGQHCRLVPELTVLQAKNKSQTCLVISTLRWHLFVLTLRDDSVEEGVFLCDLSEMGGLHSLHIVAAEQWVIYDIIDIPYILDVGMAIKVDLKFPMPLWECALCVGLPVGFPHIRQLASMLKIDMSNIRDANLREEFIREVFKDRLDVTESCLRKTTDMDAPEAWMEDHQFGDVMDEILAHDAMNESEVRGLRAVVKKRQIQSLVKQRKAVQKAKLMKRIVAKAKARVKAQAKPKPVPKAAPAPGDAPATAVKIAKPLSSAAADTDIGPGIEKGVAIDSEKVVPTAKAAPSDAVPDAMAEGPGTLVDDDMPFSQLFQPFVGKGSGSSGSGGVPDHGGGGCGGEGGGGGGGGGPPLFPRELRGLAWGRPGWHIAEVHRAGELVGWGATCGHHKDAGCDLTCKKQVNMGATLSIEQCRRLVKLWLVMGMHLLDSSTVRATHVRMNMRNYADEGDSEEALDSLVRDTDWSLFPQ